MVAGTFVGWLIGMSLMIGVPLILAIIAGLVFEKECKYWWITSVASIAVALWSWNVLGTQKDVVRESRSSSTFVVLWDGIDYWVNVGFIRVVFVISIIGIFVSFMQFLERKKSSSYEYNDDRTIASLYEKERRQTDMGKKTGNELRGRLDNFWK